MAGNEVPAIRLSNPAAEFMDNHLDAGFHPSLPNPDIQYDPATDDFRPREAIVQDHIYDGARKEREAFLSALQKFHDEDRDHCRVSLGFLPESDWSSVLEVVNNSQIDADLNAIKGIGGAIRKLTRKLGVAGPAFKGWLEMLPNDVYGSVICGGFKVIIDAAVRHRELCDEVLGALGDIPEIIRGAEFSFSQYKSEELDRRVAKLYMTITETLQGMLRFYKERASGRNLRAARNAVKAVVKGPSYGRHLEADIKNITDSAASVKQEADRCLHRRLGEMKNAQEYQTLQAALTRDTGTQSLKILQKVYADLQYRYKCQELQWNQTKAELVDIKRTITPKPLQKTGPSIRKVIQLMRTSPDLAIQDMEEVLREAQTFPANLQTQASEFMGSQKLQQWLTTPYSCALLAHGSTGDEKISALSFVASLLVQSLRAGEDVVPLYFYCGLHTDHYHDSHANAVGMVRNLTVQLLRMEHHDFDLEFIDRRFIQALENGNLEAICNVFEGLTQQLPPATTLFLIIDGMSFYENKDRLEGTIYAMSRMMEMLEAARFVFKLLVTCPGASPHVSKGFDNDQIYWLPDVDPEDDGEFNHNVGAFKSQAGMHVSMSQTGLLRSDSERFEDY
ncbi:MAG: hypothetical protein Q9166_003266 [cf. Caloplaca sp. 2 TL-2023]